MFHGLHQAIRKISAPARVFHELPSRDRETGNPLAGLSGAERSERELDGCATGSTIAECGLRIGNLLKSSLEPENEWPNLNY